MNGMIMLAIFCLLMALYAVMSEQLIMRGTFTKEDNPTVYWLGTIFYAVAGLVSLGLYFKTI